MGILRSKLLLARFVVTKVVNFMEIGQMWSLSEAKLLSMEGKKNDYRMP